MTFIFAGLALVLLGALPALAQEPAPVTCGVQGLWSVQTTNPVFADGKTSITYTVTPTTTAQMDHIGVLALAEDGLAVTLLGGASGFQLYGPCAGDPLTGLGKLACHEQAVRVNPAPTYTQFVVSMTGKHGLANTSMVVRDTRKSISACVVPGLGPLETQTTGDACVNNCGGFHPYQSVRKIETFKFKGCEIEFEFDTTTGQVIGFDLIEENSNPACKIETGSTEQLLISSTSNLTQLFGPNALAQWGDGWISSGDNSCTTRLVSGRYYTVCY
jgi:hypothetical protein